MNLDHTFRESRYYRFGLLAGWRNLRRNGFSLGVKKTLGKLLQPVNFFSRFPEYACFEQALRPVLDRPGSVVLDIGSPKLFGLFLAWTYPVTVVVSDICVEYVREYRKIWRTLASEARGKAVFVVLDGRSLPLAAGAVQAVYAMSVIEHIHGERPEREMVAEMARVLQPDGLCLLSVPYGERWQEQKSDCRVYGCTPAVRGDWFFFQRIYDRGSFSRDILEPAEKVCETSLVCTIVRRPGFGLGLHRLLCRLFSVYGMALLGFLNPLWSRRLNRIVPGLVEKPFSRYGEVRHPADVYGDAVWVGARRGPGRASAAGG